MDMVTIDTVLCPVDFSETAHHALAHATALAGWYDARLIALTATSPPLPGVVTLDTPIPEPIGEDVTASLEALLAGARSSGIAVEARAVEGAAARTILAQATETRADLIVMGTHGRGGFERFVLGSVAERIMRRAECPVMTVPPHATAAPVVPVAYRSLVCPTDFSEAATDALPFVFSLAQEAGSHVTLVHVVTWPTENACRDSTVLAGLRADRIRSAQDRLAALVPPSVRDWCDPETVVLHGHPAREIIRAAEDRSADLIVLGLARRAALDIAINGATAFDVVRAASCPVITVRTRPRT